MSPEKHSDEILVHALREHTGSVLATLIAQFRDFDLAEDALQDAVSEALVSWRKNGPPKSDAGWLLTTARRRAIDRLRRSAAARSEQWHQEWLADVEDRHAIAEDSGPIPDERLRLIFMCCHSTLKQDASVCLALRTLCGLSTSEIARGFLVSDATMTKRIVRAKAAIRNGNIPYSVPGDSDLAPRLNAVLEVIYFIFNEGFAASSGHSPTRADLCQEAIRLGRILYSLMPEPESGGLLALMLLHDSRRSARTNGDGHYVPLDAQDRHCWNREFIDEGLTLIRQCLKQQRPGPYQIQAAISAVHCEAASAEQTDWNQIVALYDVLLTLTPSPVVTLNKAVAIANAGHLAAGLSLLNQVAENLQSYPPLYAARAELLRRSGQFAHAAVEYQKAIALTDNKAEQDFLIRQRALIER